MAIEYLGLSEINGPLVVLEGVKNAAYEEIVEFTIDGKEKKLGRIVEVYEDKAVIQVFEGSDNMSLDNTHTRLTGHPMEIGLSEKILGRTFDGIGNPIDGLGPMENRTITETLDIGWKLLGLLPKEELDRIDTKVLNQYYQPTDTDLVEQAVADAKSMME